MNQYHKCELTHWGQVEILVHHYLNQLERLRSEIPFWDSHQIQSQNKTKSKLQFLKKLPKIQILKFCKEFHIDTPSEVAW